MTSSLRTFRRFGVLLCFAVASLAAAQQKGAAPAPPDNDYSGMYSFLQDGEFVQVDFLPDGKVSGFVSRYGDLESDKGAFLDHFIKTGSWKGRDLSFETGTVHSVWFTFKGTVDRGAARARAEEGYYLLKGTLTQFTTDANKKTSARSREVTLKSFPQDLEAPRKKPID